MFYSLPFFIFPNFQGRVLANMVNSVEQLLQKFQNEELHLNKIANSTEGIIESFDTPSEYLELIKKIDFPKRKQHLSSYNWHTRQMKMTPLAKSAKEDEHAYHVTVNKKKNTKKLSTST